MKAGLEIGVIGRGVAAKVAAACLADLGHTVTLGTIGEATLAEDNVGEPGFLDFFETQRLRGALALRPSPDVAVSSCDTVFMVFDNPASDVETVHATRAIAPFLRGGTSLVIHAAAPVGTSDTVAAILHNLRPDAGITVSCIPPLGDRSARAFLSADRIVIGADDRFVARRLAGIFRRLSLEEVPVVYTSPRGAELIHQTTQTLVAMHAAFTQEVKLMCDLSGVDLNDVGRAIDLDRSTDLDIRRPVDSGASANLAARHKALVDAFGAARNSGEKLGWPAEAPIALSS